MAKYIDAELFKSELEKGHDNGDITGRADVEKLFDEQPAADVREIVIGNKVRAKSRNVRSDWECSKCGSSVYEDSAYCSICGAVLEEDE